MFKNSNSHIQFLLVILLLSLLYAPIAQANVKGDLNRDNIVDVSDVNIIIDMVLGRVYQDLSIADIDKNGVIDVSDVNSIIDLILYTQPVDDYFIDPHITPPSNSEDKVYLVKTAEAFMQQFDLNDFRNLAELVRWAKNYDTSEVAGRFEDCYEAMTEVFGTPITTTQVENYGEYEYRYITTLVNYKRLLRASLFTGHFSVIDGKWAYTPAEDLQFTFTDRTGAKCVLRLTTSGAVKSVHVADDEFWHYMSHTQNDEWHYTIEIEEGVEHFYAQIPEHIELSFVQGGKELLQTQADIDINGIKDENWDLGRDAISSQVTTHVNDYTINIKRLAYAPIDGAKVIFQLRKGNAVLLYGGVEAEGYADISFNSYDDFDTSTLAAANATINVMGWLQCKVNISNIHSLIRSLENADANDTNEQEFKRYINRANNLVDAKIYYRGEDVVRGTLSLEPFLEDEWNGYEWWSYQPIITFSCDGSSYELGSYFNEDDFNGVINGFKDLIEDFYDLYDLTGLH